MDWHIRMRRCDGQHVAILRVNRVQYRFYAETRDSAWVLALRQLLEIEKSRKIAETAVELWDGMTYEGGRLEWVN